MSNFLEGLNQIVTKFTPPTVKSNPFLSGLDNIVSKFTAPTNAPLGPVPHITPTTTQPKTNQFATDFINALPEQAVRGVGLGALLDIPQAYRDMKASGGHVTPSDVLSGVKETGQGLAHLATDVITKPTVGAVELATGQKNLAPTLPILGKVTSPQQDVEEMVASGIPRWQAIAQLGANQAISAGAFVGAGEGTAKYGDIVKNRAVETYQNTNPESGFARVPGLTGNETPQELNDKIKTDAEKRHPTIVPEATQKETKALPIPKKLQLSDEGIPLARKKVPFMPKTMESPATLPELPQTESRAPRSQVLEKNPSLNDTTNKVEVKINGTTPKERIQSAVTNSERISNEIKTTGQDAYATGLKLSPNDVKLAEKYETGTVSVPDLIKQSENPALFKTFMEKMINYYDFRLAADRASGGKTPTVSNYIPHQWDLSNPKDLATFNNLAMQKGLQPYNGFKSQPRVFGSYAEGESLGFKRANPNIVEDLKNDYGAASSVISKQVLKKGLKEAVPNMITSKGYGRTATGKPFINSNVPGLEGLSYDPLVHKNLKGFQPRSDTNLFNVIKDNEAKTPKEIWQAVRETGAIDTVSSLYDKANRALKNLILNFSGFHSINISLSYGGHMLFADPLRGVTGLAKSLRAMVDENYTQKLIEGYKKDMVKGKDYSVYDAGLRSGVNMTRELNPTGKSKFNPLTQTSHMIFDRELHILKLETVKAAFGDGKIDPESPTGRAVAKEINMLMGELNSHTQNINPNTLKWMDRVLLASKFTGSKFGILKDATTKGGSAGNFARKAVIGKSVIVGILSTFGTLLSTGKFPSLQQILLNATIDPGTQTNLTNPKGQKLDVKYPKTFISEATGLFTDPKSYALNRLSPALSTALKIGYPIGSGTDQFGNTIVDVNKKQSVISQYAQNLGTGLLPIGAQAVIKKTGVPFLGIPGNQITGPQAGINIAGLQTKVNANDPNVIKYKQIDDAKNAIGKIAPDDPERTKKIQDVYNTLDADQKKSLNYQLLLAGTNTKGVLSSEAGKMKPLYDQLQVMKNAGKTTEANAIWAKLSPDDKKLYAKVKTYYKRTGTSDAEKEFEPTFTSIRGLKTSGDPALEAQADKQYNELTAKEKHIYQLLKKKE